MEHIQIAREQSIVRITITRPDKRNAISLQTAAELMQALREAEADAAARVVVLTGAGDRAFASGADLDEIASLAGAPDRAIEYDRSISALYDAMRASRLPVIARVQAAAIGGGCLLALACDLRVAGGNAVFGMPAGRIGLMLSADEHAMLVQAVGPARAKLLLLSGRRITADEARQCGLIDLVVPIAALDDAIDALAHDIAQCAPVAVSVAKRVVQACATSGAQSDAIDAAAKAAYRQIYNSDDLREGLAAFKARHAPVFQGR